MPPKGRQAAAKTKVRRKETKNVAVGQAHIKSTFFFSLRRTLVLAAA